VAVAAIGGKRRVVRWVKATGVADAVEPIISLQQGGWPMVAAASRAQHAFVSQEPMAIAGKTPLTARIATARKSVRMTFANLCTTAAIPDCQAGD